MVCHEARASVLCYLVEVVGRKLEYLDDFGELPRGAVGEHDDLHAAGQEGAMEHVLLQNTLQCATTHRPLSHYVTLFAFGGP